MSRDLGNFAIQRERGFGIHFSTCNVLTVVRLALAIAIVTGLESTKGNVDGRREHGHSESERARSAFRCDAHRAWMDGLNACGTNTAAGKIQSCSVT